MSEKKSGELWDALELAWGLLANAGGGDWTRESKDWQEAVVTWRENYHKLLAERIKEGRDENNKN